MTPRRGCLPRRLEPAISALTLDDDDAIRISRPLRILLLPLLQVIYLSALLRRWGSQRRGAPVGLCVCVCECVSVYERRSPRRVRPSLRLVVAPPPTNRRVSPTIHEGRVVSLFAFDSSSSSRSASPRLPTHCSLSPSSSASRIPRSNVPHSLTHSPAGRRAIPPCLSAFEAPLPPSLSPRFAREVSPSSPKGKRRELRRRCGGGGRQTTFVGVVEVVRAKDTFLVSPSGRDNKCNNPQQLGRRGNPSTEQRRRRRLSGSREVVNFFSGQECVFCHDGHCMRCRGALGRRRSAIVSMWGTEKIPLFPLLPTTCVYVCANVCADVCVCVC